MAQGQISAEEGSSPRWRGKQGTRPINDAHAGLIPALAGKTWAAASHRDSRRAHPRAGGENHYEYARPENVKGSSPRWRGKPVRRAASTVWRWLIPALAGKTQATNATASSVGAHPRAGGENEALGFAINQQMGSSPRWRGKQKGVLPCSLFPGLIPALAGKTVAGRRIGGLGRAHPRAGGENRGVPPGAGAGEGSSPRWRGKPQLTIKDSQLWRLIPALAGKTGPCAHLSRGSGAHPRAGGENGRHSMPIVRMLGSSPRWRGKHALSVARLDAAGLIPALAGKTLR